MQELKVTTSQTFFLRKKDKTHPKLLSNFLGTLTETFRLVQLSAAYPSKNMVCLRKLP
jgi:hypothetical protein